MKSNKELRDKLKRKISKNLNKTLPSENQGGSVAVALVSNTGESTKEARRLFGVVMLATCNEKYRKIP